LARTSRTDSRKVEALSFLRAYQYFAPLREILFPFRRFFHAFFERVKKFESFMLSTAKDLCSFSQVLEPKATAEILRFAQDDG
jgi:hypothetical protein